MIVYLLNAKYLIFKDAENFMMQEGFVIRYATKKSIMDCSQ